MNNHIEKKKLYLNFIDVILVAVILASVAALVFFLRERRIVADPNGETAEIVYQVEVSPMREEFRNLVAVGDAVVHTVSAKAIGTVSDVAYSQCLYTGTDSVTGLPVTSSYPGKITMVLTVTVTATITDTGYEVGGQPLILGEALSIRTPHFVGSGTCIRVTPTAES